MREPRTVVTRERALDEIWGAAGRQRTSWTATSASCAAKLGGPGLIRTVRGVGFVLEP